MKKFWCIWVIINLLTNSSQAMMTNESFYEFDLPFAEMQAPSGSQMYNPFSFENTLPGVTEHSGMNTRDPNNSQNDSFDILPLWDHQAIAKNDGRYELQEFSMADQSIADKIQRVANENRGFEIAQKAQYPCPISGQRGEFLSETEVLPAIQRPKAPFVDLLAINAPITLKLLQENYPHNGYPFSHPEPLGKVQKSPPKKKKPSIAVPLLSNVDKERALFAKPIAEGLAQDFEAFEKSVAALIQKNPPENTMKCLKAHFLFQYLNVQTLKMPLGYRETVAQHVIEEGILTLLRVNFFEYKNFKVVQQELWSRVNCCTWLTSLVVQNCGLVLFPADSLQQLKELTLLDLSNNQLETFPAIEKSSKLTSVILLGNALISFPYIDRDKSPLSLDISYNRLPDSLKFFYLPAITELNMSHNPALGTFKGEYFQNLSTLDIRDNNIIEPFDFSCLCRLQKLWCKGNPFIDAPSKNILKQLQLVLAEDGSLNHDQIQKLRTYYAEQNTQEPSLRKVGRYH